MVRMDEMAFHIFRGFSETPVHFLNPFICIEANQTCRNLNDITLSVLSEFPSKPPLTLSQEDLLIHYVLQSRQRCTAPRKFPSRFTTHGASERLEIIIASRPSLREWFDYK